MKNRYECDVRRINRTAVKEARARMLGDGPLRKAAGSFRLLGDPTRIMLLHALSHRELCVCDLANLLSMSQSAISHQLAMLRGANLVKFKKEGKIAYYSLKDRHILGIIKAGARHANE